MMRGRRGWEKITKRRGKMGGASPDFQSFLTLFNTVFSNSHISVLTSFYDKSCYNVPVDVINRLFFKGSIWQRISAS